MFSPGHYTFNIILFMNIEIISVAIPYTTYNHSPNIHSLNLGALLLTALFSCLEKRPLEILCYSSETASVVANNLLKM